MKKIVMLSALIALLVASGGMAWRMGWADKLMASEPVSAAQPTAYFIVDTPSSTLGEGRNSHQFLQNIVLRAEAGDEMRFSGNGKVIADIHFPAGIKLTPALREEVVRQHGAWERISRYYREASYQGGAGERLNLAQMAPRLIEWAESRSKSRRVVVLLGDPRPKSRHRLTPQLFSDPRSEYYVPDAKGLAGVAAHAVFLEDPFKTAHERRQTEEFLRQYLAAQGASLVTWSSSAMAYERLSIAPDTALPRAQNQPQIMIEPAQPKGPPAVPGKCVVRIEWRDIGTDYDLHLHAARGRKLADAHSHQPASIWRNWEQVAVPKIYMNDLVGVVLANGPADDSLILTIFAQDGSVWNRVAIGHMFSGRALYGQSKVRWIRVSELSPEGGE